MYLPPILSPSIIHTLSKFFLLKEKTTFDFPKKKSSNDPRLASKLFLPCLSPSSTSIQSPDPPRKSIYQPRSNDLHRESFLISKSRQHRSSLSPFNFQKQLRNNRCSSRSLLFPSKSREGEKEKKSKRGRLHARSIERGNEGPRGVATRQPDRYLHGARYARGRWRRQ